MASSVGNMSKLIGQLSGGWMYAKMGANITNIVAGAISVFAMFVVSICVPHTTQVYDSIKST